MEFYSPVSTNFRIAHLYHITRPLKDFPYVHTEFLSHSSIILEDTNGLLYMFDQNVVVGHIINLYPLKDKYLKDWYIIDHLKLNDIEFKDF